MAKPLLSNISGAMINWGDAIYKWLGITAGSLTDVPGNHIRVGNIFLEKGNGEEALRRGKMSAWMRKNNPSAQALIVKAHAMLGQKKEAEMAYTEASRQQYTDLPELRALIEKIGTEPPKEAQEEAAPQEKVAEEA